MVGGEWYEYTPLGKFVVSALGTCCGRPTFKYTRLEVAGVLERLGAGHSRAALITDSGGCLSREAVEEAVTLAVKALERHGTSRAGTACSSWMRSASAKVCVLPLPGGIAVRY